LRAVAVIAFGVAARVFSRRKNAPEALLPWCSAFAASRKAAAEAEAAARLYPLQAQAALTLGCLDHLVRIEQPWTVTNAGMVWNGVRICPGRCRAVLDACAKHERFVGARLREMGLANPHSHEQLLQFLRREGLLHLFAQGGDHGFDDEALEAAEALHLAVALIRVARKVKRLRADRCLTGELVGADGRLHPDHRQLGADTGRNSMRDPNVGGLGRALRPLVVPDEGCLIGEVDLSQIEVGVAAAVYHDADLVRMFNGGDVYGAMARRFFAAELPADAPSLPDRQFKRRHAPFREAMKLFTLATLYNITPAGLAPRLGVSAATAAREQRRFLGMFPALEAALRYASASGAARGFAYTCSGLRRWRARQGPPSPWEANWLRNTPVQGSAAAVFKDAGNRLHRRYRHYDARIILPMHDAVVYEAPRAVFQEVAKVTAEVLRGTVQEHFPELDPKVEVNVDHPGSWSKDGLDRSWLLWLVDPCLAGDYVRGRPRGRLAPREAAGCGP
jgi:DNA polymerase-1